MLNGLHRSVTIFLEDNFLIQEHDVSFDFVSYPSSVLVYKDWATWPSGFAVNGALYNKKAVAPITFFNVIGKCCHKT